MQIKLLSQGYKITDDAMSADLWLLNSCTVKTPSEDGLRNSITSAHSLGKLKTQVVSDVGLRPTLGWWCSGTSPCLLCRRSGVQFPDLPTLEKCAKGICLCNLLRSTQPNDRETVIEGKMRRVSVKRSRIFQVAPSV